MHGTRVAMYIVGQEETAGESSVSVVAGVRTVTTNMDGRDVLPRLSRPFAFSAVIFNSNSKSNRRRGKIRTGSSRDRVKCGLRAIETWPSRYSSGSDTECFS